MSKRAKFIAAALFFAPLSAQANPPAPVTEQDPIEAGRAQAREELARQQAMQAQQDVLDAANLAKAHDYINKNLLPGLNKLVDDGSISIEIEDQADLVLIKTDIPVWNRNDKKCLTIFVDPKLDIVTAVGDYPGGAGLASRDETKGASAVLTMVARYSVLRSDEIQENTAAYKGYLESVAEEVARDKKYGYSIAVSEPMRGSMCAAPSARQLAAVLKK